MMKHREVVPLAAACSLPPCGGGLGRGVATYFAFERDPPPCPSPTRGEGTLEPMAQREWRSGKREQA